MTIIVFLELLIHSSRYLTSGLIYPEPKIASCIRIFRVFLLCKNVRIQKTLGWMEAQ